jgi:hypothetical protein
MKFGLRPQSLAKRVAAFIGAGVLLCPSGAQAQPSTTVSPDAHAGDATLTFVRKSRFVAMLEVAIVRVNGKIVARVDDGKTLDVRVPAGDLSIDIRTDDDFGRLVVPLKAVAGHAYKVDLIVQMPGAIVGAHGAPLFVRAPYASDACGGRWCAVFSEPARDDMPAK